MQNNKSPYRVIYSARRKKVAFRFGADGILEVLAPKNIPTSYLDKLVSDNHARITALQAKVPKIQPLKFEEGNAFMLLGKPYPLHLTNRLRIFDNAFMIPRGNEENMRNSMISLYRELALSIIRKRIIPYQKLTGDIPEKVQISAASTRWGSCTAEKHITFSWKLIQCPVECVDYVIVHELSHIKEMNHSPAFWQHVAKIFPDYRNKRKQLNEFAAKLPKWD